MVGAVGDAGLELAEGLDSQERARVLPDLDDVDERHLVIKTERSVAHAVGPGAVQLGFLRDSVTWRGPRRYRLVPTRANGQPPFGFYIQDKHGPVFRGHGMIVLTLEGDRISAITRLSTTR